MKNINKICWFFILVSFLSCKKEYRHEYENLPYKGKNELALTQLSFDTITIDASSTSMQGQWLINKDLLYFADAYSVGVSVFDLQGNFMNKYIEKGRGPDEAISPFVAVAFSHNQEFVGIDMGWFLHCYNSLYHRNKLYKLLSDVEYSESDWNKLLKAPDPEVDHMYEFNTNVKRLRVKDGKVLIPILTEHIHYNGYNLSNHAKDFWVESYIFQLFNLNQGKTLHKFGHYPPIYHQKNIPVFSIYHFDVYGDEIYSSFMVDSLIYVRNREGNLLYSFGNSSGLTFEDLPETKTFEEYEKVRTNQLAAYGYFTDLLVTDDCVLRGYKKAGKDLFGLQIYKNCNLIGDVPMSSSFKFIGKNGEYYYLLLPVDDDNECFKILRFTIPKV